MGKKPTLTDAERRQLVIDHVDLAEKLARSFLRHLPHYIDLDDMRSAAFFGLIDSAERYDPSLGKPFRRFAAYRIRGAMGDEMRQNDTQSRDYRRRSNNMAKVSREYQMQYGREPTDEEMAARLGIPLSTVRMQQRYILASSIISMELEVRQPAKSSQSTRLGDQIPDDTRPDPFDTTVRREKCEQLERAIAKLPIRLQQTLAMYFGEDANLREVGDLFNVSESRACQMLKEATMRLRDEYLAIGGTA